jgi:hypothetical protein
MKFPQEYPRRINKRERLDNLRSLYHNVKIIPNDPAIRYCMVNCYYVRFYYIVGTSFKSFGRGYYVGQSYR